MHDVDKLNERLYETVAPVVKYARAHHREVLIDALRGVHQRFSTWAGVSAVSSGMKA